MGAKEDVNDEIRREAKAAAAEVRIELGAAGRETREALREAMEEVRGAFSGVWDTSESSSATGGSGRMSRAERKEMTRELLLDAATEVFAEKGYHGASLDDVAEVAGFTKGAVYSNFTRKADLFKALMERETERTNTALRQAVTAVPLELLPDVAAELLRRPEPGQPADTLMVEFWLAAVRDPSLRETMRDARADLGDLLDDKLEAADRHPGLDGRELAIILDALATGLLMSQAIDPEQGQPALYAKALHKLIMDMPLRAPEADPEIET